MFFWRVVDVFLGGRGGWLLFFWGGRREGVFFLVEGERGCLCPKERSELLEKEWDDLLSVVVRMHRLEFCWTDEKSKFLPSAEINRHEFHAEELQRRDQQLLHEQLLQQNLELREAHQKSPSETEELKEYQSSTFDTTARRRLVDDQDTILELSGKIQDLQNEINCMNDSKEFQDAESIRSGNSHVTSRPVSCPPHPIPEGMLSRSFGKPSRKNGPPSIWDTHGISGNVFVNPDASSSAPYPQELNQWSSDRSRSRFIHPQWKRVKGEHRIKTRDVSLDRQPKIQSSSVEETLQRIMEQTNNDCRFRIFISTHSLHQPRLLAGR